MSGQTEYQSLLQTKFAKHKKKKLSELVRIENGNNIKKGDLIFGSFSNGLVQVKIESKDRTAKTSIHKIFRIIDPVVSEPYLMWFFNHGGVKEYLMTMVIGTIIPRFRDKDLYSISVPLPRHGTKLKIQNKTVSLPEPASPVRSIIKMFYKEYASNYESENYFTAAILAGAISECILYNLLLEQGAPKSTLRDAGLGTLLKYVTLMRLNEKIGIPIEPFIHIQKLRNDVVHASNSVKFAAGNTEIKKQDLDDFDKVITYFGL